eukprot:FR736071.1.p1 GENE.FR736071.1~~FR736071.1.p1  ORF type:complete len:180 (+),score=12.88 FR736071.1:2-541(+)
MTRRGIEPNVITYNAAISACEKGVKWERALDLLDEMTRRGIAPNVISYSAVLEAMPPTEVPQAGDILKQAIADGHYRVWTAEDELDLHECSAAVARVILWHTLMEYVEGSREVADLVVVTGQGHGSGSGGPILPTSTREFLMGEMAPALEIREVPSNPGRFVVPRESIDAWVSEHYPAR